jgi:hypothetical protein
VNRASSAGLAGGACLATAALLRRFEPTHPRWRRLNFRERPVTLAGGPALAAGVVVAAAGGGSPAIVAVSVGAALGLYDDLYGDSHARGLRGHLRALRAGRITTGLVKLAGLVAGGVAAGVLARRRPAAIAVDAALVAGTANLVNLLDLRPGRALKVVAVSGLAGSRWDPPAGVVGAGLAAAAFVTLPADLRERQMIGDCGANAAGAALGWLLIEGLGSGRVGRRGRLAALAAVTALTVASERLSFTAVIERTPVLRAMDALGRRP